MPLFLVLYAVVALPVFYEGGLPPDDMAAASIVLAAALAVLSAIDLKTLCLPDAITLPLILLGWGAAWFFNWDIVYLRIGAAAAGFLFLYAVAAAYRWARGRDGLGLGDAKLLAAAGAWLGVEGLPMVVFSASTAALLAVTVAALLGRPVNRASRIPFGPFLALGFWFVWLYGPRV